MVISPYGEMAQSVVVRSIHYDTFASPENKTDVCVNSKANVKANGDGTLEAEFKEGFKLKISETIYIEISDSQVSLNSGSNSIICGNDQIILNAGGANIALSSNGIQLNCGASSIDISGSNISLNSTNISTMPPICKCAGGV
jgi:hypothetical protein